MISNLTIKDVRAVSIIRALVIYYNGENLIKDFPKILKSLIKEDYYMLIKDKSVKSSIIKLSEKYKVTEKYIKKVIYDEKIPQKEHKTP